MEGQIVKILSNTHFVNCQNEIYPCTCRGKFRNQKILPLVGDFVKFDPHDKVILDILPRKNALIRPSVSNVDQGFIITSVKNPDFSLNLLDKLLVVMHFYKVTPIICLTKLDLLSAEEKEYIQNEMKYYKDLRYIVLENTEILKIKELFKDKTSVFTGQTGAGKSSLLNKLNPEFNLETGEISLALGRGRHTTRHVELLELCEGKVLDTPGFSALDFSNMDIEDIKEAFVEFADFPCKYRDCKHTNEKECEVKKAVSESKIKETRYENYLKIINSKEGRF